MPVVPTRESKIYWFNWKEVLEWYADQNDDSLYDKTVKLANLIRIKAGRGNLIEWTTDEYQEKRLFDSTVMYHVRNSTWNWAEMVEDLLRISKSFPEVVFMITFMEGEYEERTYIRNGRFTAIIVNTELNELTECF